MTGKNRFHQLHCLASIRMALQESKENKDIGMDWRDNAHWPHCLDYLRQVGSFFFFFVLSNFCEIISAGG